MSEKPSAFEDFLMPLLAGVIGMVILAQAVICCVLEGLFRLLPANRGRR